MQKITFVFSSLYFFAVLHCQAQNQFKIVVYKPASAWEEALPLGNAKTGAMVFGGIATERFQLNDNTLWSGHPGAVATIQTDQKFYHKYGSRFLQAIRIVQQHFGEKCRVLIPPGIFHWRIYG